MKTEFDHELEIRIMETEIRKALLDLADGKASDWNISMEVIKAAGDEAVT